MNNHTNRNIFFIFLGLGLASVVCVFPYVLTVQGEIIKNLGISRALLFFVQFIQSLVLFSITIPLGLFFTRKINFQLPLINAIIKKENYAKILKNILGKSIFLGLLAAIIIYLMDYVFAIMGVSISTHQSAALVWQTLLAAFYGGITEEILMRLFLMTFFIWIGMKLSRQDQPTKIIIWVSILIAAIIFGLGHLPITAALTKLTPLVVSRAVVLNGVGGVIFGWLFWKKGLESAMIAHFTTDIFLLSLLPILFK